MAGGHIYGGITLNELDLFCSQRFGSRSGDMFGNRFGNRFDGAASILTYLVFKTV